MTHQIKLIATGEFHLEAFQPCLLERHQLWQGDTFLGNLSFPAGGGNRPENRLCQTQAEYRLMKIEAGLVEPENHGKCFFTACGSKHVSVPSFLNWIEHEKHQVGLFDHLELDSEGDNPLFEIIGNLAGIENSAFHIICTDKAVYQDLIFSFVYSEQAIAA